MFVIICGYGVLEEVPLIEFFIKKEEVPLFFFSHVLVGKWEFVSNVAATTACNFTMLVYFELK